jgi:phosphatidylglycerol:prolipoprotein diacylglycerol transferase
MCTAYAPVRFALDFLRERDGSGLLGADPRYAGLTPAQWASFGLLATGIYFLVRISAREPHGPAADATPTALPASGRLGEDEKPPVTPR